MHDLLREPWWKRILAGDPTAVPAEWLGEDPGIGMKVMEVCVAEFGRFLEENGVEPTEVMMTDFEVYATQRIIDYTGSHPNAMTIEEWQEMYG